MCRTARDRPGDTEAKARYEALTAQLGYRAGRGFYDTLEPAVRDRARAYVVELAVDRSEIEPMQPWLAYYTLNGAFWKKYPPPHEVEYLDQTLRTRAQQAGKALHIAAPEVATRRRVDRNRALVARDIRKRSG